MLLAWKAVLAHSTYFIKLASILFGIVLFCPRPGITVHPQKNFTSGKTPKPHWSREDAGTKRRRRPACKWTEQATRQRLNCRLDRDRNWTNGADEVQVWRSTEPQEANSTNQNSKPRNTKKTNRRRKEWPDRPWRTLSITLALFSRNTVMGCVYLCSPPTELWMEVKSLVIPVNFLIASVCWCAGVWVCLFDRRKDGKKKFKSYKNQNQQLSSPPQQFPEKYNWFQTSRWICFGQ